MPIDPQCQAVLDAAAKAPTAFDTDDPVEARRRYDAGTAVFATPSPALAEVVNGDLPGPDGAVPYRLYRPEAGGAAPLPMVAFFHGGGWIFGGLDSHDHVCREIAHQAGALVVSVDYRLAPEHKFPAAFDDCLAATRWLRDGTASLGGDALRFAVAGDSAGGNLAAAVCLGLRDAGDASPVFQYLIYPAVDLTCDSESHRRLGEGYLLTKFAGRDRRPARLAA
jgi:acetyl esterase